MQSLRNITLLLWFSSITLHGFAATTISVAALDHLLATMPQQTDGQVAKKLSELELTQRLSAAGLSHALKQMPGQKAREALAAMADKSAFLDPPSEEVPQTPAPDLPAQRHMLVLSHDYINKTIHQLPNLFATRVTSSYQETLWEHWVPESGLLRYEPLHFAGRYSADVQYRPGGEQTDVPKQRKHPAGLETSGEFGLLETVLEDAVQSNLSWSHWEQDGDRLLAVYRYTVPADKSHYQVGSSWSQGRKGGGRVVFQQFTGYRGEIAMDPSTGTILRLMLIADAKPTDLLGEANILVEYGPVVLDGKTYVCPVHSVALSLAASRQVYSLQNQPAPRFLQTSLNDVQFERYHLFHADARIVTAIPEHP